MAKTRKRSSDSKTTKTNKKKSSNNKSESSETKRRSSGKRKRREDGEGRRSKRRERNYTSARDWANQETSLQYSSPSLDLPDGVELYRLEEAGTIYLDMVAYVVGDDHNPRADKGLDHFERTFWVHWVPTADGKGKFHTCLSSTFDEDCPVCEAVHELRKDPESDEDLIKRMSPKKRQMFNVVDAKNPKKGVQLLELSYHNFGSLLKLEMDEPDEDHSGFFYHDGERLKLRVEDTQFGKTTFQKIGKIEFKSRKKEMPEELCEQAYCLDELVAHPTYDELNAVIKKSIQLPDDDDDDDKPKGKKKRSGKKKSTKGKSPKKATQDDDWDDDAQDDDLDDDDAQDADDIDDDDDWDDDAQDDDDLDDNDDDDNDDDAQDDDDDGDDGDDDDDDWD